MADALIWYIYSEANWLKGVNLGSHDNSLISTSEGARKGVYYILSCKMGIMAPDTLYDLYLSIVAN